jgi:dTDP-4-dehydrorhamnose 3,5-epimerase
MKLAQAPLAGLWIVETAPRGDARGRLTRLFCADAFERVREGLQFVQVNHSVTALRGTLRGLHFQRPPRAEAKLIRCLRGSVFDVAVDLRPESPTFGRWYGVELSEHNEREIFIPEGCAHGFQALSDDAQLLYQHTAPHTPECEAGVRHDDPELAIAWPLPPTRVSARDRDLPSLRELCRGAPA